MASGSEIHWYVMTGASLHKFDVKSNSRTLMSASESVTLGCRKWGFKRWGLKQIEGYLASEKGT